jgi:hypothetical protein
MPELDDVRNRAARSDSGWFYDRQSRLRRRRRREGGRPLFSLQAGHKLAFTAGAAMANEPIRLTPRLCRAAQHLAEASGVPKPTIVAFEAKRDSVARIATMNNRAVVAAFEGASLQFIPENGGGVGVRLKDRE